MSTDSDSKKTILYTVDGTSIEADSIVSLERVPADPPSEDDAFKVTFTSNSSDQQQTAWISYHWYCMLRDADLIAINREADALE